MRNHTSLVLSPAATLLSVLPVCGLKLPAGDLALKGRALRSMSQYLNVVLVLVLVLKYDASRSLAGSSD